eukprot:COSAG02_NODE_5792_length_4032_cov_9.806763_3_plen_117_part_00
MQVDIYIEDLPIPNYDDYGPNHVCDSKSRRRRCGDAWTMHTAAPPVWIWLKVRRQEACVLRFQLGHPTGHQFRPTQLPGFMVKFWVRLRHSCSICHQPLIQFGLFIHAPAVTKLLN